LKQSTKPTLQSVIMDLQRFWAEQGCVIWQPHHTEVGAGTMNPATFLRVLGPEPWWVGYVEPSIRPADGRYGENPNRWQHFYQFQVILKPDPGNPQERYLDSLIALGINPHHHDLRFVEDNWLSPALGAWGLGWEVWLDGQEITQYTYFQQAGGQVLDPVSVEITYGLERILLALQGEDTFLDLRWNEQVTYGEVNLTAEKEHSRYNFELADVEGLKTMYDEYESEAENCLRAGLVFPAHDYVLKCSHTFNLLDSRGVVGVTERAMLFGRMRELARRVADQYLEQREQAGFPWMDHWQISVDQEIPGVEAQGSPETPTTFLLEIGTEELPPADLASAVQQLRASVSMTLKEHRLEHGVVEVLGTPRRLVVWVENLAVVQTEQTQTVKGPPADRAFDEDGNPTKAAQGFARGQGVSVETLIVREMDGGEYVVAEIRKSGSPAWEVLRHALPGLLGTIRFDQAMRWNRSGVEFSRPIRWLVALHGETIVPFTFAGVATGRETRMLRFSDPDRICVETPDAYRDQLEAQGIILDLKQRQAEIKAQVDRLAAEVGGEVKEDPALLIEVANMVEKPTALRGAFEESFLDLPQMVLVSVLKTHQRCFPVYNGEQLLPYFVAVRNGDDQHLDEVRSGNEHVVRARFADAEYFVKRDLSQPLEAYLPRLSTLTFQTELGSMLDKAERVERLAGKIAEALELKPEQRRTVQRAARLCKADLVTNMVIEMTSLQGEMGRVYALHAGEPTSVAEAIYEHYLPRSSGDVLPATTPGLVLGIADRLDTLMGLFAAGLQPTGARDPYALRRAAIGLVQSLVAHEMRFDLREGLRWAGQTLPIEWDGEVLEACLEFILARQQAWLLAEGYPHDVVEAVLSAQGHDPAGASSAASELSKWVDQGSWSDILHSFARCVRIIRGEPDRYTLDPQALIEPASTRLLDELQEAEEVKRERGSVDDFIRAFQPMIPAITSFFDDVLVMAEDQDLRRNRLALLQRVVALADGVLDFSKLEGF
jgi:glycyl-tRNA synthetase